MKTHPAKHAAKAGVGAQRVERGIGFYTDKPAFMVFQRLLQKFQRPVAIAGTHCRRRLSERRSGRAEPNQFIGKIRQVGFLKIARHQPFSGSQ
jgi:hypothetical protein